jgi:hypothetical protein
MEPSSADRFARMRKLVRRLKSALKEYHALSPLNTSTPEPAAKLTAGIRTKLALTIAATGAVLVLDAFTPLGLAVWLFQVALVWLASFWASRPQMLVVAVACSSFIVLGFLFSPKTGLAVWIEIVNLMLSLGAVGAITQTCLRQKAAETARQKAAEELAQSEATVRVLSGLLPICAACKKIRNEAGAWEQLEIYIRNHSQAEFTHGICEDCAARLYPELGASLHQPASFLRC